MFKIRLPQKKDKKKREMFTISDVKKELEL